MRVDFIGHASLLVESNGVRLLTDPWWEGPAYHDQWYPYPFPVPERFDLRSLDGLYISHGHEDHMHAPTLAGVTKDVTVVIPRSYEPGNQGFLRELGFREVAEVANGASHVLRGRDGGQLTLTLFTALGDSILAVEDGSEVLLNVNDALHYAREDVIEAYCRLLRARFPRIDYLFCGFGGASYFPNCFRVPGKDDASVAAKREHMFLENFALIARRLAPRLAFPFAAHFVLPDERNWWISELRLRMPSPRQIVAPLCRDVATEIHDLAPGDHVEDGRVHAAPTAPAPTPEAVRRLVLERYPRGPRPERIDAGQFRALVDRARANAVANIRRLDAAPLLATISLWDYPEEVLVVRAGGGRAMVETRPSAPGDLDPVPHVALETRSDLLEATLNDEYGRDLICIGYGALVRLSSREGVRANTHERLFRLVAPFSTWRERLQRHPVMCASFLARDPGARHALLHKLKHLGRPAGSRYALEEWA
jgi:beta-lactamase family protein